MYQKFFPFINNFIGWKNLLKTFPEKFKYKLVHINEYYINIALFLKRFC